MHKKFLLAAAVLGALSVALGAFGAHALKEMVSTQALTTYETGVRYQFYHVFALLAVAILYREYPGKLLQWSGRLFITGMVLFSGSLYAMTALQASSQENFKWIGAITPLGGVAFIAGWLLLAAGMMKKKS